MIKPSSNFLREHNGKTFAATPFGWIEVEPQFKEGDELLEGLYKSVDKKLTIVINDMGMAIIDNPAALRATF